MLKSICNWLRHPRFDPSLPVCPIQVFFDGHFMSGAELKRLICEKKNLQYGPGELSLSDPSGVTEFGDEHQIPKNSKVVVKRKSAQVSRVLTGATQARQAVASTAEATASGTAIAVAPIIDDFGADPFTKAASNLQDEQAAARALALAPSSSAAAGGGWGMASRGGRAMGGRGGGGGRGGAPPPASHECRRCGEVGKHWWYLCPTKDDPEFDPAKPMQRATGIPTTSLRRNADGSMLLPDGQVGELAPNLAAFAQQLALMAGTGMATAVKAEGEIKGEPQLLLLPAPKVEGEEAEAGGGFGGVKKEEQDAGLQNIAGGLFDEDEEEKAAHAVVPLTIGNANGNMTPELAATVAAMPPKTASSNPLPSSSSRARPPPPLPLDVMFRVMHAVLAAVMPPRMTMRQLDEAFGAGGPLSRAEFERFQAELRSTLLGGDSTPPSVIVAAAPDGLVRNKSTEDSKGGKLPHTKAEHRRRRSRSRSRGGGRSPRSRSRSPRGGGGGSRRRAGGDAANDDVSGAGAISKKRSGRHHHRRGGGGSRSASPVAAAARRAAASPAAEQKPRRDPSPAPVSN